MPKVSDEHRESRRAQIIEAALRSFAEKGFQRTSMADIIAASGLSAGAIYLHFPGKREITLAASRQVLSRRLGELGRIGEGDGMPDPADAIRTLLTDLAEDIGDTRVLVQLWGEAVSDPAMLELVQEIFTQLQRAWTGYLTAWGTARGVPDPASWAAATTPAVIALAQGFLLQGALVPGFDPDAYIASVRAVTGPGLNPSGAEA